MRNPVLLSLSNMDDYTMLLNAITGVQSEFTSDEAQHIMDLYMNNAKENFGTTNEQFVQSILFMDIPAASTLADIDKTAIQAIFNLYMVWNPELDRIQLVESQTSVPGINSSIKLAAARATLDAYINFTDSKNFIDHINAMKLIILQATKNEFSDAKSFLVHLQGRAQLLMLEGDNNG